MKKKIGLGLINIILCLSLIGMPNIGKANAQPAAPDQVSSPCGSDPTQVGCWQFSEGSGTTTADGSGNSNTGTLVGATWVADRFGNTGKALHFNGTSQYVKVTNSSSLNITSDITIAAWVKPEVVNTQDLVKKAVNGGTNGYELALSTTGTTCNVDGGVNPCAFGRFNQVSSADAYRIDSMTSYTATVPYVWSFYAITYTDANDTIQIYRNGVLSNTRPAVGLTITANSLFLGFGAQLAGTNPDASRFFTGSLDDIRIYKRALSLAEVKSLYNNVTPAGYTCTDLTSRAATANTEHKPMSKVWNYDGRWWSVFPASSGVSPAGAWLWRLDGTTWTPMLNLSTNTGAKADVKPAGTPTGSVVHILLYNGSSADLASVQYDAVNHTYIAWSSRPGLTSVSLPGSETATIDIDSIGRMWLNTQHDVTGSREITIYESTSPYSSWNGPNIIGTGTVNGDDISVVTALPNNTIGVLWANENTHYFVFRYHKDIDPTTTWSTEELPISQYGYATPGTGFSDDHINVKVASDGTLYAAIKTSYDTAGYPKIALMVRRLSGTSGAGIWDANIYGVSETGTRGIIELDEAAGIVTIIYTSVEGGGNILFRQSAIQPISFGSVQTMRAGSNNDVSSTKQNINGELVAIYSSGTTINGSKCTSTPTAGVDLSITKTDGKDVAQPGDASTYTIVVSNGSTQAVSNVVVADTFPTTLTGVTWACTPGAGSTCTLSGSGNINDTITLAASGTVTYIANATISPSATGVIENTATVTPPVGVTDPVPANNSATDYTNLQSVNDLCGNDPNLVACYEMDEGSGTIILDGVPNPVYNDGTIMGTAGYWTSIAKMGTALDLNGSNNYAYTPDVPSLDIASQITLAAWVKPERYDGTPQYLIRKGFMDTTDGYEISLSSTGSTWPEKVFFRLNQDTMGDTCRVNSNTLYPHDGNTWMHVAATFDGVTMRLYINGVLDAWLTAPVGCTSIATNNLPLALGAEYNGTTADRFFQGTIDDVRVYNDPLTAEEIADLYDLPTAVNVSVFTSMSLPQGIRLEWQSAQETDLIGFNLIRAEALDGSQVQINPQLVPAINPGQLPGNVYLYLDAAAETGKTYYYWVEWVGNSSSEFYGPITASLAPYMVWLPLGLR